MTQVVRGCGGIDGDRTGKIDRAQCLLEAICCDVSSFEAQQSIVCAHALVRAADFGLDAQSGADVLGACIKRRVGTTR
jgi:hypothetical protein